MLLNRRRAPFVPVISVGAWLLAVAATPPAPYEATRSRPLFAPTRRKPPPPMAPIPIAPAAAEAPAPPPPDLALTGVVLGGSATVALLRRARDAAALTLPLGARVDGWTVSEIRRRAVVLRLGSRSVTLSLPDPP